ncbi:hypothetical protein, partial [Sandarakinorhabdus sp.]|uniref:hypothetical protein n=1 Tax=Sandarakinorhabdus sp. TaxID=1916663 RepID=UPI0033402AC4
MAAELEQTAIELELLAVRLANVPGLANETIMCLQTFDELAQRQRELARLIRGDTTVAALGL